MTIQSVEISADGKNKKLAAQYNLRIHRWNTPWNIKDSRTNICSTDAKVGPTWCLSLLCVSQTPKSGNVSKYIPLYRAGEILLWVSQTLNSANVMCFSPLYVSQTPKGANVIKYIPLNCTVEDVDVDEHAFTFHRRQEAPTWYVPTRSTLTDAKDATINKAKVAFPLVPCTDT